MASLDKAIQYAVKQTRRNGVIIDISQTVFSDEKAIRASSHRLWRNQGNSVRPTEVINFKNAGGGMRNEIVLKLAELKEMPTLTKRADGIETRLDGFTDWRKIVEPLVNAITLSNEKDVMVQILQDDFFYLSLSWFYEMRQPLDLDHRDYRAAISSLYVESAGFQGLDSSSIWASPYIEQQILKLVSSYLEGYPLGANQEESALFLQQKLGISSQMIRGLLESLEHKKLLILEPLNLCKKSILDIISQEEIQLKGKVVRNTSLQMFKERLSGKTLEEIGSGYGVTRERVRQDVKKMYLALVG